MKGSGFNIKKKGVLKFPGVMGPGKCLEKGKRNERVGGRGIKFRDWSGRRGVPRRGKG